MPDRVETRILFQVAGARSDVKTNENYEFSDVRVRYNLPIRHQLKIKKLTMK
jgi:hypothetical protein